jgi:ATP-dependent Clp protease adaptor protein ClpS
MFVDLATQLWPMKLSVVDTESEIDFSPGGDVLEGLISRVILYNDNYHTFDEVIDQVCKAVSCSEFEAEGIAWEVHTRGQALVFEGELIDCLSVSSVLEEIALHTQVMT